MTYKHGKARDYWPDLVTGDRKVKIVDTWKVIVELLESKISGVKSMLPIPSFDAKVWEMKAFEDQLDAAVWRLGLGDLDTEARLTTSPCLSI